MQSIEETKVTIAEIEARLVQSIEETKVTISETETRLEKSIGDTKVIISETETRLEKSIRVNTYSIIGAFAALTLAFAAILKYYR